ncbi:hypothetical protein HOK40_02865 [Candidatus Peregrinibacteria bacterium]|nr:hypothetical protein [Candidatus Peregrinibacteria bacterium]
MNTDIRLQPPIYWATTFSKNSSELGIIADAIRSSRGRFRLCRQQVSTLEIILAVVHGSPFQGGSLGKGLVDGEGAAEQRHDDQKRRFVH